MGIFDSVFGKKEKTVQEKNELPWIPLESLEQLEEIKEKSKERTQVIYKHSVTCGISSMVLKMFTGSYDMVTECDLYFLRIQDHRDISSAIAETFNVIHESPQLLIVKDGGVVFHTSHGAISNVDLKDYQ
ncbi:bacillithiol system redox-active protein YtxJ [Flagellimonas zhangzhouensis]|uniref:Bacillithiol system protein YtxJ n=1 Tax=Flagellimonas zhangzhouensis TaxID=1073328 RepID=A0A1H2S3S5_9FLAO|nr:bacillithiol system redox-active protein YtxJ [Allomuricauda zhangzhouensis]SDQ69990.1 bacillithiol system protein YtxJ [Allomuricauda zhangzhouensis]SDW25804.1 bacillithiol system protein YtxJ [Allomuricauda zhangzhouensis]